MGRGAVEGAEGGWRSDGLCVLLPARVTLMFTFIFFKS